MSLKLPPEIAFDNARAEYNKRSSDIDSIFQKTLKIVSELQHRLEDALFTPGMQSGTDMGVSLDPKQVHAAAKLGQLVSQLQAQSMRLAKEAKQQIGKLSLAEKVEYVVSFASKLPVAYQVLLAGKLREAGIIE